ncbi:hypothetical protein PQX77_016776 [Marasmius sp. AFHP31]|nr:hypothetical protein PQX77_016776 [Marasmius sp. AFHP31]
MASKQEIAKQALEPFTSIEQVIVYPISTLLVMFLMYGMYIIIFGLSLNVLWQRRESSASKSYLRWIITLFVLITINNAGILWNQMGQTLDSFNAVERSDYIPFFNIFTSDRLPSDWVARIGLGSFSATIVGCIFDYLMVHRCYVIWGYSKWILYPFGLIVLVTDGFVVYAIETAAYQNQQHALYRRVLDIISVLTIIEATYAFLLTLLTAGRIWWTVHQVGQIAGGRIYSSYKIFVATILESGLLFSATQVAAVALVMITDSEGEGLVPFDPAVITTQMAVSIYLLAGWFGLAKVPGSQGIAPTLIIVRIAHGQAVENVQQMVSTLQFAEGTNNSQPRSMATQGFIDLQQSFAEAEERGSVGTLKMLGKLA